MEIDRSDFAEECVDAALYCGVFAHLHYLIAVAQLRSKISDTNQGEDIGPFRLVQKDWDAYRSDADFEFNFLSSDINIWRMQPHVFALIMYRAEARLFTKLNRNPSAVELYQEQWPQAQQATLVNDLKDALASTANLLSPAAKAFFGEEHTVVVLSDPSDPAVPLLQGAINFKQVPTGRKDIAEEILRDFAQAGFKFHQQVAALANAIAESKLDPSAHAGIGEDSFGLFQLNRRGGLGAGHAPSELVNPESNIAIVIKAAQNSKGFTRAATLDDAVSAFVRDVERPSGIPGQIRVRVNIAHKLVA
jgi:Lysozyme like domain